MTAEQVQREFDAIVSRSYSPWELELLKAFTEEP